MKSKSSKIASKIREREQDKLSQIMRDNCQYDIVHPKTGKQISLNLYDLTRVDAGSLDECLAQHSGWYMFFGALWAEAQAEASALEASAKRVLAVKKVSVRKQLLKEGKATDKEVDARAEVSKAYLKAHDRALAARHIVNVLEQALAALRQRQRTMDELSQNRRREWYLSSTDALKDKVEKQLDEEVM